MCLRTIIPNMCTKFHWKWLSFVILNAQKGHFWCYSGMTILAFSCFHFFVQFRLFKNRCRAIFCFIDENLAQNMYPSTETQNFKWTFLALWPKMTFIQHKVHKSLRGYPRQDLCRSIGFISTWYAYFAWQKCQKIKSFTRALHTGYSKVFPSIH